MTIFIGKTPERYTPLVEVNQALIAWSFRQITPGSPPNPTINTTMDTFLTPLTIISVSLPETYLYIYNWARPFKQ